MRHLNFAFSHSVFTHLTPEASSNYHQPCIEAKGPAGELSPRQRRVECLALWLEPPEFSVSTSTNA
jgi:hypothetical protein